MEGVNQKLEKVSRVRLCKRFFEGQQWSWVKTNGDNGWLTEDLRQARLFPDLTDAIGWAKAYGFQGLKAVDEEDNVLVECIEIEDPQQDPQHVCVKQPSVEIQGSFVQGWNAALEECQKILGSHGDELWANGEKLKSTRVHASRMRVAGLKREEPSITFSEMQEALAKEPTPALRELMMNREPIPMVLHCPECRTRHIDEGDFATKVHHTHSCQGCGLTWRPAVVPTVGVQFLPGFKWAGR